VPGTSFELWPAVAAFNLGALMGFVALAAILPVADYLSRQAHNEAKPPLRMQDVFGAMAGAHEQERPWDGAAAAIVGWLGGGHAEVEAALRPGRPALAETRRTRAACAAGAALAVRRAYLALKLAPDSPAPIARQIDTTAADSCWQAAHAEDFAASVRALFPARQAALICTRLADRAGVTGMPVHEFVALLVRNG
jgi:hypothetical protein